MLDPVVPGLHRHGTSMGRATHEEKNTIAHAVATGEYTVGDLAAKYGYTHSGMSNLIKAPDMRDRIASARAWVEQNRAVAHTKLLVNLPAMIELAHNIARDQDHKDQASMVRYCIDKVMPTVQIVETHSEHQVSGEVFDALVVTLKQMNEARGERRPTPKLLSGPDALPAHGEYAAPQDTPARDGNGGLSDSDGDDGAAG